MLAADQQLIAVQISAIVIVQTKPMAPGHRHFTLRRSQEK
jgi:hypothetical protein